MALYGVGLTGDGQDALPSAAVHVEAPRRVLHEFRDGDEHLPIRSPTKYDSARAIFSYRLRAGRQRPRTVSQE